MDPVIFSDEHPSGVGESEKAVKTVWVFASGKGKIEMTDDGASFFSSRLPKQPPCWRTLY